MTEENKKAKRAERINELIEDLKSRNDRKVIGALKRVPHEGSPEMMEALFSLYELHQSKEVNLLLEKSVHNLKDSTCIPPMITLLEDDSKQKQHTKILASFWQSGLDTSEYLDVIVERAIKGNFLTAVEAMTVIENLEFNDDEKLTTAIQAMDEAVEVKDDKQGLMVTLRQILLDKLLGGQ